MSLGSAKRCLAKVIHFGADVAKGKVWNFGSSAIVSLWPYPHIRLKARVLFAEYENDRAGSIIDSTVAATEWVWSTAPTAESSASI